MKRLLIDIAAARQSYNHLELAIFGLVTPGNTIADAFIKVNGYGARDARLRAGVNPTPEVQLIVCPPLDPPCETTGNPTV